LLEAGDIVPADGLILNAKGLQAVEAQLTGESYPSSKTEIGQKQMAAINRAYFNHSETENISGLLAKFISKEQSPQLNSSNYLYQGTFVATGKGMLVVLKIGMDTEVGKISTVVLKQVRNPAPIELKIKKLTKIIFYAVTIICLLIFAVGLVFGIPALEIFKTSISLGVSAIPEGLPVVVTLTLAIGAWRMGRVNAILKNLASASTLAGATIICTDKTGTITEGRLIHSDIYTLQEIIDRQTNKLNLNNQFEKVALVLSNLCNNAILSVKGKILGDPLDLALIESARNLGIDPEKLQLEYERLDEIPFDSSYKYIATLHKFSGSNKLIVKGAPEVLLSKCQFANDSEKTLVNDQVEKLNKQGLRTILLAEKQVERSEITHDDIADLNFSALLEFIDPLRKEVGRAIEACKNSGIKVIMITGDHLATAKFIAEQAKIFNPRSDLALTGEELIAMNNEQLNSILDKLTVIARANPETKMRLINAYQKRKHIVAMTGDGVNDAPALTAADIGIAMGKVGTDVARESADMVLTDDNFATIVKGIEEARVVYENLRKVIIFLFSTAIVEVFTIIISILIGLPLPLVAVQILWLNLLTDGPLDVALATEKKEADLMQHNPRRYTKQLIARDHYLRILFLGVVMTVGSVLAYLYFYKNYSFEIARSAILLVLAVFQWYNVYNVKSDTKSLFKSGIFSNRAITLSIIAVVILQLLATYNPFMQRLLQTSALSGEIWVIALVGGLTIILAEEIRKFIAGKYHGLNKLQKQI